MKEKINVQEIHDSLSKIKTVRDGGTLYYAQEIAEYDLLAGAWWVAQKHPFMDGNKRTAFALLEMGKGRTLKEIKFEFKEWLKLLEDL